jgi:predicted ATPase
MLSHFSVKNYKCLADESLPLTPIHVLIGQNDTGKTSLLEAMQAAVKLAFNPDLHPFNVFDTHFHRELIRLGSGNQAIHLAFQLNDPIANQPGIHFAGDFHNAEKFQITKALPSEVKPFTSQIVRFRPKLMARPAASNQSPQYQLQQDGFGLSALLEDITGYDVNRFVQLQAAFCEYFPKYSRVMLTPTQAWSRQLQDNLDHFQSAVGKEIKLATRDGDIRLSLASDGAILLLGFLALTYSPNPPGLLLIEEPENGIHPTRLIEIVQLLRKFVKREENAPQIILTTHSPYLLSQFQPEEVTLMQRQPDGRARAFPLRNAKHIHERMGDDFYLGELWYNLTEEELLK